MGRPTRESLLEALRSLAARRGPNVTVFTFRQETGIAPYYINDRWGNWTNLRRAAGLPVRSHPGPVYSNDELLAEYHRAAVRVDDYPTHAEFNRLSDRNFQTLETRFGNTADVHHRYREWLAAHCPGASPKFLEGCPVGFEPTAVPGLNIIDETRLRSLMLGVGLWLLIVLMDPMTAPIRVQHPRDGDPWASGGFRGHQADADVAVEVGGGDAEIVWVQRQVPGGVAEVQRVKFVRLIGLPEEEVAARLTADCTDGEAFRVHRRPPHHAADFRFGEMGHGLFARVPVDLHRVPPVASTGAAPAARSFSHRAGGSDSTGLKRKAIESPILMGAVERLKAYSDASSSSAAPVEATGATR